MKEKIFIALGSNMGDREANCLRAVEMIGGPGTGTTVVARSSLYETDPWGVKDQPPFINAVIEARSDLRPLELLVFLRSIEIELGRKRDEEMKWGPREMDLDIIFYGKRIIDEGGLKVPHPGAAERAFVLFPLVELCPDFEHPVLKKTVSEIFSELEDKGGVRKLSSP